MYNKNKLFWIQIYSFKYKYIKIKLIMIEIILLFYFIKKNYNKKNFREFLVLFIYHSPKNKIYISFKKYIK